MSQVDRMHDFASGKNANEIDSGDDKPARNPKLANRGSSLTTSSTTTTSTTSTYHFHLLDHFHQFFHTQFFILHIFFIF